MKTKMITGSIRLPKNKKVMQTIQTVKGMGRKYKPIARCTGGKKEQANFSTVGVIADGFLKHQFLPLFE